MGTCCSSRGPPRPSNFEQIDDLIPHLETVIRRVPVFKELRMHELARLARAMEVVAYEDGDFVFEQAQVCPNFYIVLEGTAIVRIRTGVNAYVSPTGSTVDVDVKTMHPGDFFGEISMLLSKPRKASVVALGHLECARISREDFNRAVGRLDTILKRNRWDTGPLGYDAAWITCRGMPCRETYNACAEMFELEPLEDAEAQHAPEPASRPNEREEPSGKDVGATIADAGVVGTSVARSFRPAPRYGPPARTPCQWLWRRFQWPRATSGSTAQTRASVSNPIGGSSAPPAARRRRDGDTVPEPPAVAHRCALRRQAKAECRAGWSSRLVRRSCCAAGAERGARAGGGGRVAWRALS
jgi:hypothetical protein